jgi:hypothetical protein
MFMIYFIYKLNFNYDRVIVKQLITFVHLYSCNNITLKIAVKAAET